ncbi:MAG: 23S rRNA (guanosine(2251)-2'-O)-methyltransferase RlmB [Bacteroidetes bacterium]|nr:MAG: 23S rRNA (guanosine(2251)-2'-O)-methyltransferase RlmB [Bacteroidota bacterium]
MVTVYGRNSVEEALEQALNIRALYVDRNKKQKYTKIISKIRQQGLRVDFCDTSVLDKTAGTRKHRGIVAELEMPGNIHEEFDEEFDFEKYANILALDGITDVMNLGAIIRSALLFGCDAVVLPMDACARITPAVIRASAGAVYKMPIFYIKNLNRFIDDIHAVGGRVYGLAAGKQNASIDTLVPEKPFCFVIGSERKGMRKSVRKKCDELLNIPTTGKLDSLNASVAAAISLWEVYRKMYK